jgi:hypothetical protein
VLPLGGMRASSTRLLLAKLFEHTEAAPSVQAQSGAVANPLVNRLPSRLVPHRHRPRGELQAAHEPQVDMLR